MNDQVKKLMAETGISKAEALIRVAEAIDNQEGSEAEENPSLDPASPTPSTATSLDE